MTRIRARVIRSIPLVVLIAAGVFSGGGVAFAASAAPPSASTGAVTAVTPTAATITGVVNPNGTATSWYFEYGPSTSTGYPTSTPPESAGAGSADVDVSRTITGLSPATSYRYRLVAMNSAGSTYGTAGLFNTTAAPSVVTGSADHLTAATATLNGVVNPEGLATHWYFQYGRTIAYGGKSPTTNLAAGPNNENVSAEISGLTPQTTYHFRLVATSSAGKSYGVDHTLTTGLSVTLNASLTTVTYGTFVLLSGTLTSGVAGANVTILSQPYDQSSYSGLAAVVTGPGGAWSYSAQPSVRTTYEATAGGGTSSPVVVGVRPTVYLNVVGSGQLSTRVVGAESFASHVLQLQRLSDGLWVTWKHVRLNASGKATFSTALPKGRTMVRMAIGPFVVGPDQAGPGYLAGFSRAVAYLVH